MSEYPASIYLPLGTVKLVHAKNRVGHDIHVMSDAIAGGERHNLVLTHSYSDEADEP